MRAEQSLQGGNLQETLEQLQEQVRSDPADARLRVFLFQLLAINGDWNRALTQLNVAGELHDGNLAMMHMYREALSCEALRAEVFAGGRAPLIFGEPDAWMARLIEALRLVVAGQYEPAARMRDEAYEAASRTSGTIDDQPFEWIADADSRLGPVLEVIFNGRYYWVPFDRIQRIHLDAPADLRDLVWMPAHFTWANGGEAVGLVPTRYPDSQSNEDPAIRMARKTDWIEKPQGTYLGLGQRTLATDAGEYPLMEVRTITLNTSVADLQPASDSTAEGRRHG